MYRSKKGKNEGGAVAVILIALAFTMVIYIMFIPPEERQRLLDENITDDDRYLDDDYMEMIELVAESPGLVTPTREAATIHRIPTVNIFLKEEPKIITLAQSLSVSNGLFSESSPKLRFRAEDLDETTNINLFFSVQEADGELRIKLNDNTIYTRVTEPGVQIVEIAKSYLERNNEIEISVSSGFFTANRYTLEDVGVKQEFQRVNNEETKTFTIPAQEKKHLSELTLKYTQICNAPMASQLTRLEIFINDYRAQTSDIRCVTTEEEIELDKDLLVEGSNTITFRLEKGDFSFAQMRLETESRESSRPTYFFSLTEKQYEDIRDKDRELKLHLLLDNNRRLKNARLLINSNEILMQTERNVFDRNLRDYALEGTNFIKIIPINSFNIVGLKVTLEEKE